MQPLLSVDRLRVSFPAPRGQPALTVVRDATFEVEAGEFVALVGESGCGKSITALTLTRLPPTDNAVAEGSVRFDGTELLGLTRKALRGVRGRGIAYVFQDPSSTLNPVLRVGEQLREALPADVTPRNRNALLLDLLRRVQLPSPEDVLRAYPHELSGGMQQRVVVAMAAAARPHLLVADEPTTALDVTTQQHVLALLDALRRDLGMGLLLITHNLGLVARHADRVGVMYAGEVVEWGPAVAVLSAPLHPYTSGLLHAVPRLDLRSIDDLRGIPGRVPHPSEWPTGCAFAPRCPRATPECSAAPVPVSEHRDGRRVRCLHPLDGLADPAGPERRP